MPVVDNIFREEDHDVEVQVYQILRLNEPYHGTLASMSKTFNLKGMRKGFYPYRFNKKSNAAYIGPMSAKHYFSPESMKAKKKKQFDA